MTASTKPRVVRAFVLSSFCAILAACGGVGASAPRAPASAAAPAAEISADLKSNSEERADGKPESKTWKRSVIVSNSSRLMVGDRESLPLRAAQAKVTIDGFRARVLLDYLYENDRSGGYEGNFQLRLPDGASPYFFAFGESTRTEAPIAVAPTKADAPQAQPSRPSVSTQPLLFAVSEVRKMGDDPLQIMQDRASTWRAPREARMVPREKAAFAYGEIVRQRIDPALLEWEGAGVFSARVFPLVAHKVHRVVVGYDMDLVRVGDDLEYRMDLPEKMPPFVADVSVAAPPQTTLAATPQVKPVLDGGRSNYRFDDLGNDRTITVRLKKPAPLALVGSDAKVGDFFATSFQPALPPGVAAKGSDRAVFLVDTSLSSNPDRYNVWLKLLGGVLEKNRDTLKSFAVLFFNIETHWYQQAFVDNTKENVDAMLGYANSLALEGATDLGAALAQGAKPEWLGPNDGTTKKWDMFLLSDGASTWGTANPHALVKTLSSRGFEGSLFAYQTGMAGADIATLSLLTREAGGAVFTVNGESEVERAVTAHRSRPWQIVETKVKGGSDVMLAGRPKVVFPGQTLLAVGRGALGGDAEVELTLARDGQTGSVKVKLGARVRSALAARTYGQVAVGTLEELGTATEKVSAPYATHFRVVGKTCSLLMLESEDDYKRYNIRPDEDAFVIQRTPAGEHVAKVLKEIGDTLGDPKASFLAFVNSLGHMPGVKFEAPASFRAAVDAMPPASFAVEAPALVARTHDKKSLPPAIAQQLEKHSLDYDVLSAEARNRMKQAGPADALRALSSLVEEQPGDIVLARDVAFSAMELGLRGQAYNLMTRVAQKRPYEPQTYRAMAQVLAAMDKNDLALAYFEIALIGQWDQRFGDLPEIVRFDYLRFLKKISGNPKATSVPEYVRARLERLDGEVGIKRADLVVMITWNTDNTDVDLHVREPTGEECYYENRNTRIGGKLTRDVTRGYGPEMYVLSSAKKGPYSVRAHYYASDRNRASTRTKVYATVYEGWGTAQEKVTEKVVALETGKDMHDILTVQR